MRDKAPLAVLLLVGAGLTGALASLDLPAAAEGHFWSDGATYYAAALSLAYDGDLVYEARDVLRVRREWPAGPQGIFLKRASGGLELREGFPWIGRVDALRPKVYFAKALAYPVAAAPFARVLGTRGILVFNGLCLTLALLLGYLELRRRAAPWASLALACAIVLAGVTPVYALWLQPELFNLAMVAAALFAWSRGWPLASALLFAIATYSKPTHVLLALPLGAAPLLGEGGRGLAGGLREALRRGLVLAAAVAVLFGANALVTGEANYQGGERKTFYDRFPFETHGVTFGNSGIWMTTEHVGPRVSGESDENMRRGEGAALDRAELEQAFVWNLGYFWWGRFGGAVPYFLPVALAGLVFLIAGPRSLAGWTALSALLVSYVFYIWLIPANWFGGGGTIGNRYFLSLVPLAFLFAPRRREWPLALLGAGLGLAATAPILAAPIKSALEPWHAGLAPFFRALPIERTMLNDLPIFLQVWRKKQPFGDADGAPGRPGAPDSYWLYFPDDASYGKQRAFGSDGFWLRAGNQAEVLVRAQEPVKEILVTARGAPGRRLVVSAGSAPAEIRLAQEPVQVRLRPSGVVVYYDSFVYVLRARTSAEASPGEKSAAAPGTGQPSIGERTAGQPAVAEASTGDDRAAFVSLALSVEPRPRR